MNPAESGEKHLQEITVPTVGPSISGDASVQQTQNIIQSNIHNVQTMISSSTQIMGKSVSLDLSPKLPRKSVTSGPIVTADPNKMSTAICSPNTVRLISPSMIHTVERQAGQPTQQIVANMPPYHVPRGPAAVANISAPRAAIPTPIVRSSASHSLHVSRSSNPTVSSQQWQSKASATYTQTQRYPVTSMSRVTARTPTTVYSGVQQSRLVTPSTQGRSVQTAVLTGAPSRLIAPVLQTNNAVSRVSITQSKPAVSQTSTVPQVTTQPTRLQTVQTNPTNKPQNNLTYANRIAVTAPVISSANKIVTVTSIQTPGTRQLSINTVSGASRIVIPQSQSQAQTPTARVLQTVTTLSNYPAASRTVPTTSSVGNVARVVPPGPNVTRITSMPLQSLTGMSSRTLPASIKIAQPQNISHAMQIKSPVQQVTPKTTAVTGVATSSAPIQSIQGQYLQPPNTTTYFSLDQAGNYSPFRQTAGQPLRFILDTGYDESHNKTNSSPRPSILRKREHDTSPAKANVVKNLVPVLACMSASAMPSNSSPPPSPGGDGCQSSGSTTVSATSSPGLDEPEQSRIPMNANVEMSPRKKPRKQQLTVSSVELTESRCTEEEMQFIVEEKVKKEPAEETREIKSEKKMQFTHQEDIKPPLVSQPQSVPIRTRPVPSLLGSSWKNTYNGKQHHYRRPSEVRPREERKLTVAELAQQKFVLQKVNGWKIHHLTTQMDDLAELEKQVHEKLKSTLTLLETQKQNLKNQDDDFEKVNELIKGNMQRSNVISDGMIEAHEQLIKIFRHKEHVTNILQRCSNKRSQKKRDK